VFFTLQSLRPSLEVRCLLPRFRLRSERTGIPDDHEDVTKLL